MQLGDVEGTGDAATDREIEAVSRTVGVASGEGCGGSFGGRM
jgi:hypothetical protein